MPSNGNTDDNDGDDMSLDIKPIENNTKDQIEMPDLAEKNIIPRINTSNLFIGSTGMGKSTLITNLVTKKQFYGGKKADGTPWFDMRVLISPTGDSDDVQKELGLDDSEVITDLAEAPGFLKELMSVMKEKIKAEGAHRAPKILLIYDDVISHPIFMKSREFIKSFIANRHYNFTVFLGSQSWTKIPRAIRLQARGIFYFPGGLSEVDLLCDEYCPAGLKRADFLEMINYATKKEFSFLFINKSVPMKTRFRQNLKEIIQTSFFKDSKKNPNFAFADSWGEDDNECNGGEAEDDKKENDKVNSNNEKQHCTNEESKFKEIKDKFEGLDVPPNKVESVVRTRHQNNSVGERLETHNVRKRRNFEQLSREDFKASFKKPPHSNKFRSKRLKSSYFT